MHPAPCAAPPILFNRWSYAGWITALVAALPTKLIVGVFYIVGASLWTLEAVLSLWVLQLVSTLPSHHCYLCLASVLEIHTSMSWARLGEAQGLHDPSHHVQAEGCSSSHIGLPHGHRCPLTNMRVAAGVPQV